VPVSEIQRGNQETGVRKINIDTDNRHGDDRADPQSAARQSGKSSTRANI